jgi:hypothetical protein
LQNIRKHKEILHAASVARDEFSKRSRRMRAQ